MIGLKRFCSWGVVPLALFVGQSAQAVLRIVPDQYPTIQAGLTAVVEGDTVLVRSGVYQGEGNQEISFPDWDVVLLGESGAISARVVGGSVWVGGSGNAVAVVEGFTLDTGSGCAICVSGNRTLRINGCHMTGYSFAYGDPPPPLNGAILAGGDASVVVTDCLIDENVIPAVGVYGRASVRLVTSTIRESGGGAEVTGSGQLTIDRCVIRDCNGGIAGGVMVSDAGELRLEESLVTYNFGRQAGGIGGIAIDGAEANAHIVRSTLAGNASGVEVRSGSLDAQRSVVRDNFSECGQFDLNVWEGAIGRVECCAVDSTGVTSWSIGFVGEQVWDDPRFCLEFDCYEAQMSDYSLREDSPCLAENSPCGELIGALGQGCGTPPTGACCFDNGPCLVLGQITCGEQGGSYIGDGATCDPNPCEPTPVQPTTWGRIKASYR
jgi:hypothetical protein